MIIFKKKAMAYVSYWLELKDNIEDPAHMIITFHSKPVKEEFAFMPNLYKSFFMDTVTNALHGLDNKFEENDIHFKHFRNHLNLITDKEYPLQQLSNAIDHLHDIEFNFGGDAGFPVSEEMKEEYRKHGWLAKPYWSK